LIDFFCWTFSQSTNLIDLLTTEKQQQSGKSKEIESEKKADPSFYVTTNWRFMKGLNFNLNLTIETLKIIFDFLKIKEIYICLQKMVFFQI